MDTQPTTSSSPTSTAYQADIGSSPKARRGKMGRRALIATGGIAAVGVIVAEAPLAVEFGKRLLAEELANLEGIALDEASKIADATLQAVDILVIPIADALSGISVETLNDMAIAVTKLEQVASTFGVNPAALATLVTILNGWQQNAAQIPATVTAVNTNERDSAHKYLAALKAKQKREAANV